MKERKVGILKQKELPLTTADIEVALIQYFEQKNKDYFCTKGVSSTLGHECDFIQLNRDTIYANEIEIKISIVDLKADKKKNHNHESKYIRTTSFILPRDLVEKGSIYIDETHGIYSCRKVERILRIEEYEDWKKYSPDKIFKNMQTIDYEEYQKLYEGQKEKWEKSKKVKYVKEIKFMVSQVRKPKLKKAEALTYEKAFNEGELIILACFGHYE